MDKHELITILITAVAAAVAKEVISWLITTSKQVVATLRTTVIPWINRDALRFDLLLQAITCIFFGWLFLRTMPDDAPLTRGPVRAAIIIAGLFFLELNQLFGKLNLYFKHARPGSNRESPAP